MKTSKAPATPSGIPTKGQPPAPDSRRRLSREERRDQLLSAAADLIAEGGLAAVTMEGVAERSGVSKALPYHHFVNADDLLVALYRREVAEHRIRVRERGLSDATDPSRAAFRAFFRTVQGRHVVHSLLTEPTHTPGPLRDQQLAYQYESERYFANRYRDRLNIAEDTAFVAACIVLSSLNGTIRAWTKEYGSAEEIEDVYVAMIDGGLRALRNSSSPRGQ